MTTFFGIALETLIILLLVGANGFFVAAEFALVKVRASQLRPLAKTGGWRVRLALKATKHLDAALSASQLGITLASLGLGWVGEPFVARRLGPLLAHWDVTDPTAVHSISLTVHDAHGKKNWSDIFRFLALEGFPLWFSLLPAIYADAIPDAMAFHRHIFRAAFEDAPASSPTTTGARR